MACFRAKAKLPSALQDASRARDRPERRKVLACAHAPAPLFPFALRILWRNPRAVGIIPGVGDVTQILAAAQQGDPKAAEELLPLVYEELRKLAAAKMAGQPVGHTLQPTALVHEAWLRLAGPEARFEGRTHFFAAAAEAMRHILVDHARRKSAQRHGGGQQRVELDEARLAAPENDSQILAVNDALDKLALENKLGADLVKLRYFGGLTLAEAAQALGVSERTADNYWAHAKVWLVREIQAQRR
jgi:RNA polymerase sigma factor (TIGR02999 family)